MFFREFSEKNVGKLPRKDPLQKKQTTHTHNYPTRLKATILEYLQTMRTLGTYQKTSEKKSTMNKVTIISSLTDKVLKRRTYLETHS